MNTQFNENWVDVSPTAEAVAGIAGVALAVPQSYVFTKDRVQVFHTPTATAVVGPAGIAHAQSDLHIYTFRPSAPSFVKIFRPK